jgi:hypothetical protein
MELPAWVCVLKRPVQSRSARTLGQVSGALGMNAPVELMILEECEPMPSGKTPERSVQMTVN